MNTRDWNQLQQWDGIRHRTTGEAYLIGHVEKIPDSRSAMTIHANILTAMRIIRASNPDEWETIRSAERDQNEIFSKRIEELNEEIDVREKRIKELETKISSFEHHLAVKNKEIISRGERIRGLESNERRLRDSMLLVRKELEYSLTDGDPDAELDERLGDGTS